MIGMTALLGQSVRVRIAALIQATTRARLTALTSAHSIWRHTPSSTKHVSMSAIHKGLRQSERVRPQGFKPGRVDSPKTFRKRPAAEDNDPLGKALGGYTRKEPTRRGGFGHDQEEKGPRNFPQTGIMRRRFFHKDDIDAAPTHRSNRDGPRKDGSWNNGRSSGSTTPSSRQSDWDGPRKKASWGNKSADSIANPHFRQSDRERPTRDRPGRNYTWDSEGSERPGKSPFRPSDRGGQRIAGTSDRSSMEKRSHHQLGLDGPDGDEQRSMRRSLSPRGRSNTDGTGQDSWEDRGGHRKRLRESGEEEGSEPEKRSWDRRRKSEDTDTRPYQPRHMQQQQAVESTASQSKMNKQPLPIPYTTAASEFLYGTSVITAALESCRRKLYKLYIYAGRNRENVEQDAEVEKLARKKGVKVIFMQEEGLRLMNKMSGFRPHNGYVLEVSPIPQLPVKGLGPLSEGKPGFSVELGHQSIEEAQINGTSNFIPCASAAYKPLVVVVDQVQDPGNLGAILRSLSFLGATAVGITKGNTATLTPVVLKASAGAAESMTLFSVDVLANFLLESREHGWQVYAAAPRTSQSRKLGHLVLHDVEERDPLSKMPCILVMGSEGEGLSRAIKGKADYEVSIPRQSVDGRVDSLNVSVAAALLCSAFLKGQVKTLLGTVEGEKAADVLF